MSFSPTATLVSKSASQLTSELYDSTEPNFAPPGGLGIEGLTTHSEFEHHKVELEVEDCASAEAAHKYLRPPGEQKNNSDTDPTRAKDEYPRIQNRLPSSYRTYFVLSMLSTLLSLAYVVIAIWGPVWAQIRDPSIAKNVASLVAKLIEASFGSICVLYLGQLLTRRSTSKDIHQGVSLDQICMRDWIIDPGSMVGDGKVLWLGTTSFLGWYVLVAAVAALFYGTASQNLIQPALQDTQEWRINMRGMVKSSFANEAYLERSYRSSLVSQPDQTSDRSFMSVVYSARGSDCWNSYLTAWNNIGNHTPIQSQRLAPWTIDRSTQGQINGSWVQSINMTNAFSKFGRVVNNVTLAIAHPGILEAARSSSNSIAQPAEFKDGVGWYNLRAQIPSPYVNVLCANVKQADLKGLVYEDQVKGQLDSSDGDAPAGLSNDPRFVVEFNWDDYNTIKSPVDSIFNWNDRNKRPIFYRYPEPEQTLLNGTIGSLLYDSYGRNAAYLLAAPKSNDGKENSTKEYSLCSMQAGLLADCHTQLTVVGNSSVIVAHCGEPNDSMSYAKRNSSATDTVNPDWVAVASLAAKSVALNAGESGGYADNPIYLTKLILTNASLSSDRPSIAESLAAILMPSLAMAARDSPFEISSNPLQTSTQPASSPQSFPAMYTPALYASGGTEWYKRLYIIIFVLVFLMNVYMLYYLFLRHRNDMKIDICDPMNLFGLAAASTFSHFPESSLILSPKKETSERPLSTEWKIRSDEGGRMEIAQVSPVVESGGSPNDGGYETGHTPLLAIKGWGRGSSGGGGGGGKHSVEESIEMV